MPDDTRVYPRAGSKRWLSDTIKYIRACHESGAELREEEISRCP